MIISTRSKSKIEAQSIDSNDADVMLMEAYSSNAHTAVFGGRCWAGRSGSVNELEVLRGLRLRFRHVGLECLVIVN